MANKSFFKRTYATDYCTTFSSLFSYFKNSILCLLSAWMYGNSHHVAKIFFLVLILASFLCLCIKIPSGITKENEKEQSKEKKKKNYVDF